MFKAVRNYCCDETKWKKWTLLMLWSIFFYGMYLRVKGLSGRKFSDDEYWQLRLMEGSFKELLEILPKREFCSFLSGDYYLIYPFFKIFGYERWGLAIPHIVATLIGFYLLYRICRLFFKTPFGYIVTFLVVSFNATMIHHAAEIRVYAVLPTLAMASFLIIHAILNSGIKMKGAKLWICDFLLMIIILFHAYGVLIVFFPLVYLLWAQRQEEGYRANLKILVKHFFVIGLITAPLWLYSVFGPHLTWYHAIKHKEPLLFQFIPNPAENLTGFLKAVIGNLVGFKPFYVFLLGGVGLILIPYRLREKLKQVVFVILLVFCPIGVIFISDIRNDYWFVQRQFIWVMPFFALFLGWILETALLGMLNVLDKPNLQSKNTSI